MRCLIQYWYIVNSISFLHVVFTEVKNYTDMLTILYILHAKVEFLLKLYCELLSSLCMRRKKRKPSPEYQGFLHNCEVHKNYCYIYITWIHYDFWMQLKSFRFTCNVNTLLFCTRSYELSQSSEIHSVHIFSNIKWFSLSFIFISVSL